MATMNVKDAAGSTVAVEKPNSNGRAAATASRPVALSTEDKTALDAVATSAKQDTIIGHVDGIEGSLTSILAKLIAAPATEAKQDALIALSTLPAGTDRSATITTGGTAQQLAAANASRKSLTVQNISDADMWINEIGGAAAVDTAGSWKVPAGSVFSVSTNRAVSIVAAATGKKFTATEV